MTRCSRIALAALLCACDPQADTGYLGEPLMTLQGHVTSSGPMPSLEAAMLWQRGDPPSTGDQELATRAPVEAGFPARFTLHLYQPPPGAARRSLVPGEVTYARANAGAVPYGIAAGAVGALPASANGAYGIDANHWVVYLASDVPGACGLAHSVVAGRGAAGGVPSPARRRGEPAVHHARAAGCLRR